MEAGARSAIASNVSSFAFLFGELDEEWQYGAQLHVEIVKTFRKERMRRFNGLVRGRA